MVRCARRISLTVSMMAWLFVGIQVSSVFAQESTQTTPAPVDDRSKLLCILLDGFRWDYFDRAREQLPGFSQFLKEGIRAAWLNPPFPSLSYPSWTSIVTGQYPETHGIVNDYIYDNVEKELFALNDSEVTAKEKWWTSEPLWTTATRADMEVAVIRWARCDVGIKGTFPEFCRPYDGGETFRERLDMGVDKLNDGFELAMVYFGDVELVGHTQGPDSDKMKEIVAKVDSDITYLQSKLEELQLSNQTNIIIMSDHGMTNVKTENVTVLEIDDFLNVSLVDYICGSVTFWNIKVPKENVDIVYKQLQNMTGTDVFLREDIPESLHIKKSKYINEIVVIAKRGVIVHGSRDFTKQLSRRGDSYVGQHGYYPSFKDMRGIFFAKGPDFVENSMIPEIDIVDVYQVLTSVLRLEPQPHNGTWDRVMKLFREPLNVEPESGGNSSLAIVLLVISATLLAGIAWRFQVKERCKAAKDNYSSNI